ncbi:hypothetical protein FRC09_004350 [Ceratobasidium sp. 395]|nr:hypothetical protein FRC09_004350 [Ceratobasidium sp. 395]
MPRQGMSKHDVERLGKLRIECAYGTMSNGATVQYMQCGQHKVNFMPYPNGEWEYFPLYPWEGVSHIRLGYTSKGLSCWSWQQWRIILKAFAERKEEDVDDLAVVTQIQAYFNLHKRHCPELGLQPIYFFRKPNPKTATQHEFWGFFSFNPDPTGPAGISFRWDIDSHGCLVSDSIPLNAPLQSALEEDSGVDSLEIYFSVDWLTTKDDWHNRIRTVLEQKKVKLDAQFDEDDIVWSDDGDNTRDNPCFVINQLIESVITT